MMGTGKRELAAIAAWADNCKKARAELEETLKTLDETYPWPTGCTTAEH